MNYIFIIHLFCYKFTSQDNSNGSFGLPDFSEQTLIFKQRGPFQVEDSWWGTNKQLSPDDVAKYPRLSTRTYTVKENGFITVQFAMPDNIRWNSYSGWTFCGTNMGTNKNSLMLNNTPLNQVPLFSVSNQSLFPVFKGDIITDYGVIDSFRTEISMMQQSYIEAYTFGQYSPEVNFIPYLKKNK